MITGDPAAERLVSSTLLCLDWIPLSEEAAENAFSPMERYRAVGPAGAAACTSTGAGKAHVWHGMAVISPNGAHRCAGTRGFSRGGAGGMVGAQPTPASGLTRTTSQTTSMTCPHGRPCRCAQCPVAVSGSTRATPAQGSNRVRPPVTCPAVPAHCWSLHRLLMLCGQSSCAFVHLPQRAHQRIGALAAAPALRLCEQGRSAWGGAPLDGGLAGVSPRAKAGAYDGGPPWEAAHPGGHGILDAGKDRKSNAEITPLEVTHEQQAHPTACMQRGSTSSNSYLHWASRCVPWADRAQGLP